MYFLKNFIYLNLAIFSFSSFATKNGISPIDDHICNKILEYHEQLVGEIKRPRMKLSIVGDVYSESYQNAHVSNEATLYMTFAWIFYGKCLLLNSEGKMEVEDKGIYILQTISNNNRNIHSAFFLAQYYEKEKGNREEAILAYENTIFLINEWIPYIPGFFKKLANTGFYLMRPGILPDTWLSLYLRMKGSRLMAGLDDFHNQYPDNETLIVNSKNQDWWINFYLSYYKLPQLVWFRFLESIKQNPFELTNVRDLHKSPDSASVDTVLSVYEATNKDDLIKMKEYAENCMTVMERRGSKYNPIYEACEGLRNVAFDLLDGRNPTNYEEAEIIEDEIFKKLQEKLKPLEEVEEEVADIEP